MKRTVRRRERGSTILYAIILSGVAAALALANMQVATTSRTLQDRREDELRWRYVDDAAAALLDDTLRTSPAFTPSSLTLEVGGEEYDVAVAKTATPKVFRLTISNDHYGTAYADAYDPRGKHPFLYSLFVDGDATLSGDLTIGSASAPAHAYFQKEPNISSGKTHEVYGALDVKPAAAPAFDYIEMVSTGIDRPDAAKPGALDYTLANSSTIGSKSIGSGTYGSGTSNYVFNVSGDVTITGTIRGRVTVFTPNKITIQAPLRMADADSKLVLICKNDMIVSNGGVVQAFAFCEKKIEIKNGDVTWTGSIVCDSIDQTKALTLVADPFFWNADELTNFRVPQNGYGLD